MDKKNFDTTDIVMARSQMELLCLYTSTSNFHTCNKTYNF